MPDNPVKAKISVMNWVQAADDASQVTADVGLKEADKLDSNIRILFSLAGLDAIGATVVVVAATVIGWLGAWLVTGHFLRQTRPTAT